MDLRRVYWYQPSINAVLDKIPRRYYYATQNGGNRAFIEGLNNKLKLIKRRCLGFVLLICIGCPIHFSFNHMIILGRIHLLSED